MHFKKTLSALILFSFEQAYAAPPVDVGGVENLNLVCPVQTPLSCPSLEPRVEPTACEPCSPPDNDDECTYYTIDFSHKQVFNQFSVELNQTGNKGFGCFEEIVNNTINDVEKISKTEWGSYKEGEKYSKEGGSLDHVDGAYFTYLLWSHIKKVSGYSTQLDAQKDYAKIIADNKSAQSFINCTGGYGGILRKPEVYDGWLIGGELTGSYQTGGGQTAQYACKSGEMAMAKGSCQLLPKDQLKLEEECGQVEANLELSTPISLVWSENYLGEASTVVSFKLNPHSQESSWLWRGSSSLPLLVYDPKRLGVIESATQLFGSWTFGGKGQASINESGVGVGTPWSNGYEALSKMDKNLDGKVSGAELDELSLWFDNNRNGLSEQGEVKTLQEVSISALFYAPDVNRDNELIATKGYERELDGDVFTGKSIDWSEKSIMSDLSGALFNSKVKEVSLDRVDEKVSNSSSDVASKTPKTEFAGIWKWTASMPAKASGLISFDAIDGQLVGATIAQVGIAGKASSFSRLQFAHFVAEEVSGTKANSEVKFVTSPGTGATLTNYAVLEGDGSTIKGRTIVSNTKVSGSGSFEYSWIAKRVK